MTRGLRATHLRRYGVWYGAAAALVLTLVFVTPVEPARIDANAPTAPAPVAGLDRPWRPGSGELEHGTGTTRSGAPCTPGLRQLPGSTYSLPCLARFDGDNGGATFRGVTNETIRIVYRTFPDSANLLALQQQMAGAGLVSFKDEERLMTEMVDYFNRHYELYGRRVELIRYESRFGDQTLELQNQGREGACQDVSYIVNELDAFGVFDVLGTGNPFSECAAAAQLVVFTGSPYFAESRTYRVHDPYIWNTTMECERIAALVSEYIGKRLVNQHAVWAGDPDLASRDRLFGTYVPDVEDYTSCVDRTVHDLESSYPAASGPVVTYALDVSRFADQATRAVVRFKAEGVTTVVLAADAISVAFLTSAAEAQDYHPEWFIIGVGFQDFDQFARTYAKPQVDGHLFGLSQIGESSHLLGPDGEAGTVYRAATGNALPIGASGQYFQLVQVFNLLMAAGPVLTPQNMAAGIRRAPAMGDPNFDDGRWYFAAGPDGASSGDHTAIDDTREVYWDATKKAPDGGTGSFVATSDRRFGLGEVPTGPPAFYPGRAGPR